MNQQWKKTWSQKFYNAFRGLRVGVVGQSSFAFHLLAVLAVVVLATTLRVSLVEWCLLALCVTVVLTAEMFNTALERLAKAIDQRENPFLRDALDISSAAVLLASLGAAVVGGMVFLHHIATRLG